MPNCDDICAPPLRCHRLHLRMLGRMGYSTVGFRNGYFKAVVPVIRAKRQWRLQS